MSKNPLSDEQIKKINEISKLPIDKQKNELSEFLKTLNEEQIEFLRNQQNQGGCLFCSISNNQIDSYKVYDDGRVLAVLDINPASKGHVLVFPREHFQFLGELNNELNGNMFNIVNKISGKMVEGLKAEGVSIYVANGFGAGQKIPHIFVNVIPRYKGDGINFGWSGKKIGKDKLEDVANILKTDKIPLLKEEIKKIKPRIIKAKKFVRRIP